MALIQFENVFKYYANKTVVAVNDLSLGIEAGEFLTLLGPSDTNNASHSPAHWYSDRAWY